jgi:CBS domain containing-hemolysin-like protein
MDETLVVVYVAIIGLLLVASSFFSMSETAFTSANQIKLKKMANDGNQRAAQALNILEDYNKFLTTILIGNNLVNIASTSLATMTFAFFLGEETGAMATTVVMTLVVLIFGEIVPKSYAKKNPEKTCMGICRVVHAVTVILSPLSWVFRKLTAFVGSSEDKPITEDELEFIIDDIQNEGVLEKRESELVKNALRLDDVPVSEVFIHRVDIVGIEVDDTVEELGKVILTSGFSRIPVYDETIDNIVGVVYSKNYFTNTAMGVTFTIRDILMPVRYIPETVSVADALSEMQKTKVHMAVVLDSYGGTRGILTLEDLLEELVGQIWDESDYIQEEVSATAGGVYVVKGLANLDDVMEQIGIHIDRGDYTESTMTGFIMYKLERSPSKGDVIELDTATITVTSVKGHRVIECTVAVKNDQT